MSKTHFSKSPLSAMDDLLPLIPLTGDDPGDNADNADPNPSPSAMDDNPSPAVDTAEETERMRVALKKANREAKENRLKLDAYEKAEEERKLAALSETERLTKERDDARAAIEKTQRDAEATIARANERLLRAYVLTAAADFADPEDAWNFIDRAAIAVDEDGNPSGIDAALKTIREKKPYLLKANVGTNDPPPPRFGTPRPSNRRDASPPSVTDQIPKPIIRL